MKHSSRPQFPRILAGAIFAAAAVTFVPATPGAEIPWIGGAEGAETDFNLGANWLGGNLPAFYNEATNNVNGDIAVFDGGIAGGVDNKTPIMTAAFGNGANDSATWGLLGVKFVDSGWTLDTGENTLYVSQRDATDLRSEATSGTNTVNGRIRFGARDTNDFSVIYAAAGGTFRLNANVGIAIDGGGNFNGAVQARGGGTLELNTTGQYGTSGLQVYDGTTVRFFAETAGGVTGNGTGGVGTDRTLQISSNGTGGTVDLNGAAASLNIGTLWIGTNGVLTNSSLTPQTIITKAFSSQPVNGVISGNISISYGANANATTTIGGSHSYTGMTTIASSSGSGATNTIVATVDALPNADGPFGNGSSAITLGNGGNSTTHAALLTNGAIEIGRNITLGAATNASGLKTIGAASTQVGNSTFSGTITVGNASQAHLTVTAPADVTVNITGEIVESPVAGNGNLTKVGLGTVALAGSNSYAGSTTINAGALLVSGALSGTSSLTVNAGGSLVFGGLGDDRINDAAGVTLGAGLALGAGGILNTGGVNEGPIGGAAGSLAAMGVLTLGAHTTIDFSAGTGSNLLFAGLAYTPGDAVRILNWTGSAAGDNGASTNDRLLFMGSLPFSDEELGSFQFFDDSGAAFPMGAMQIAFNGYSELVPIPEPSAVALSALMAGCFALRGRRRAKRG